MQFKFSNNWELGERIDGGGFGEIYAVLSTDGQAAAAKIVPKSPGARRELLFVDLGSARNVVPIIDSGETPDSWVLVMPRAERSLASHLAEAGGPIEPSEAVKIISDITTALVDLDGKVVHRDLKPANVLLLDSSWCLADFGISRYAEATTEPSTRKFALSPPYAAPERWRAERATTATDVYSLGVIAFEILSDSLPFPGPETHDLREQHLHATPPALTGVEPDLNAIISECLFKAAGARPSPANILARLSRIGTAPQSSGMSKLRKANLVEVQRMGEDARRQSELRSKTEQRAELYASAKSGLTAWDRLRDSIKEAASSARIQNDTSGQIVRLNQAQLEFRPPTPTGEKPWGNRQPAIDVISHASISLRFPPDRHGYEGRSHSLWYCDAQEAGRYQWFETAFMISPLIDRITLQRPYAMDPSNEAAKALWVGIAEYQVAWPFTPLNSDEFVDRWAGWFADAAQGLLQPPHTMPERPPQGSWRNR